MSSQLCAMKPTLTSNFFTKLFATCERNNIVSLDLNGDIITGLKYGPLGYLLKRNIYREWLTACLSNSDINVLPLQTDSICVHPHLRNTSNDKNAILHEILKQYKTTMPLVNHQLPFAFAASSENLSSAENNLDDSSITEDQTRENSKIKWKPRKWTSLSIALFCESKKSSYWFYYWQRQRYTWWRKLSLIPSQFSISDLVQNSTANNQVSLLFQFPWGCNKLENVTEMGSSLVGSVCDSSLEIRTSNESPPAVILCQTDLDFAVVTYLCNAFGEKWRQGKLKTVLQLHQKLAPYKVAVIVDYLDTSDSKKLINLANQLIKDFKKSAITVFPNAHSFSSSSPESQFDKFDEMGIPYAVILSTSSLVTGIAGLRNRDTTLQEKVHVTEMTSKLLAYLQIIINS